TPFRLPPAAHRLALATLALTGCARRGTDTAQAAASQTLLLGNGAEPKDLDPQVIIAFTDANIVYALFEGLTVIDEKTSEPVAAAAESWTQTPDGLRWTFKLRPTGKWSNGDPVTAEDFAFSIN